VSPKASVEKRRHPRVDNSIPVKISASDADYVTETKNISCSGAYCRVGKYIEPMTKLAVTFLLPCRKAGRVVTRKISCHGVVVRTVNALHEEGFFTAIFFSDINAQDSRLLNEYVNDSMSKKEKAGV
jgi:hypothetical protein